MRRLLATIALCLSCAAPVCAEPPADLALILAVDCSGSVDDREFQLQMQGLAKAFRDADIVAAAIAGPRRQIAVNLVLWADEDQAKTTSGWTTIASRQDAENFAKDIALMSRPLGGGRTGLGEAIRVGISLLQKSGIETPRQVIDVSGDGHESWDFAEPRFFLLQARALRATTSITVNGLAITINTMPTK
jgi:hypothetical protein